MDVAVGALNSLVPKLRQLLTAEYKLQSGVKQRIYYLTLELENIQSALHMVSEVPPDMLDEQVRNWAPEAREATYIMEDRIDTILVVVHGYREPIEETGCWCLERAKKKMGEIPSKGRARADIATAIEDMMKQVKEISERYKYRANDIVLRPVTSTSITVDPRLPALYRNEWELVDIEEARKEVVRLLRQGDLEDDKKGRLKVVSIVGLAGVGKTTLAKAVYNRLQAQFGCSAFVSVSRNPDLKKVFMDILHELDEANYHMAIITAKRDMDERQLINEIRRFLQNKRYFIVIDDIWEVESWEAIRVALYDGGNGSRIITTTRKCEVARHADTIYRLKPLSYVNSKILFYKRIFGNKGMVPDNQYDEVSDRILKKCGGLSLAIITIASVLASKPREKWSEVYNAIVFKREGNRYTDNMRRVLSFSFYDLPFHLRACLLHLSTFPETCFIEKDFLIWKWVAEGFVVKRERRPLFETGEYYFNELVNRSMIQIAEECLNNGSVYGCRVHPVLFSHIRAISSEENFCTVLEDEHHTSPGNNNSRRIAMHSVRNVEHSMEKVRSFNASLCFIDGMPQLSSFQVLRVLALEYCPSKNTNHLKMIGNLALLRYLGLVGAGVLQFPEETLGGLRFLQTLDLRETDIEQWPRTISKLGHLMCLCVGRTRTVPEGMMSSLEDLRLHLVSSNSSNMATELIKMQELRVVVLGFEELDVELEKALVESLCKLPRIQRLEIYYCKPSTRAVTWEESRWVPPRHLDQLVLGGLFFYRLPSWINPSSLEYLSHLHLEVEVLEDGDLETLARFPYLRCLVLMAAASGKQHHHITTVVSSSDHAFNKLNFFSTNMAVRFESGPGGPPMPNLEHIELYMLVAQCADSWLSSLANMKSLEKVRVVLDCQGAETEEAEEKVRRATGIHPNRRLKLEVTKENGTGQLTIVQNSLTSAENTGPILVTDHLGSIQHRQNVSIEQGQSSRMMAAPMAKLALFQNQGPSSSSIPVDPLGRLPEEEDFINYILAQREFQGLAQNSKIQSNLGHIQLGPNMPPTPQAQHVQEEPASEEQENILIDLFAEKAEAKERGSQPSEDSKGVGQKRKMTKKGPSLVDSEVRRSPRLSGITKGFKYSICTSLACFACKSTPPILKKKALKNIAIDFCGLNETEFDSKIVLPKKKKAKPIGKVKQARKGPREDAGPEGSSNAQEGTVGSTANDDPKEVLERARNDA